MTILGKIFLFIIVSIAINACDHQKKLSKNENKSTKVQVDDLKVGGLYLFQNEDETYFLTKILVVDDSAVHICRYENNFKVKPIDINSDTLKILYGHTPMDKNGYLIDNLQLIKVEKIKDSELEGYKIYLETMEEE